MNRFTGTISKARARLATRRITNEDGAVDLASIMVGILILGIIAGIIAATVFGVIPWAQDNAAAQSLDAVKIAESTFRAESSTQVYGEAAALETAKLLPRHNGLTISVGGSGTCFLAGAQSATGAVYWLDSTSQPTAKRLEAGDTSTCGDPSSLSPANAAWDVPDPLLHAAILSDLGLAADHQLTLVDAAKLHDGNDTAVLAAAASESPDGFPSSYVGLEKATGVTALGDLYMQGDHPTAGLENIRTAGSVFVWGSTDPVAMPSLETASDFQLQTDASSLDLPKLKTVTGSFFAASANLTTLSAPLLEHASFAAVDNSPLLTSIDLHSLSTVDSTTDFSFDTALQTLSLPALVSTDDLNICGNDHLSSADLPALTTLNGLGMLDNPVLDLGTAGFPKLTTLGPPHSFDIDGFTQRNPSSAVPTTIQAIVNSWG